MRQFRDGSRQGSDGPAREPHGPEAEFPGNVDEGDHVVSGDVVGPRRTGANDTQAQRLGHVFLMDELEREIWHESWQAGKAPQRCAQHILVVP